MNDTTTRTGSVWFGVNQPARAANLLLRPLDSLERRLLLSQLRLWNSQLTNTLGKIFCRCKKESKYFSFASPSPHSSICPRSSHPSQWCQSGPAGASVWGTWWPGRRCQQSEVPPSPTSHSFSPRPLFFKLSYSFLISSLLYFLHLLANPVVLAKFPSLICCSKVFSPTAFCCPSFPKYLLVILRNREQRPNIHVLLEKCQMTAAKIFPKRERDMANQANAP